MTPPPHLRRSAAAGRAARRASRRAGASAVELAFVLPVLLTMVFACLDYGRAICGQIALTNVARVGAEYGATHRFVSDSRSVWEARIKDVATDEATSIPSYKAAALTLTVQTLTDSGGVLYVVVAAQYQFKTIVPWPGMPRSMTLRHQVGMRQYQ